MIRLLQTATLVFLATVTAPAGQELAQTINGPARVIDGDTIVVRETHMRLEGIDAAELKTEEGKRARLAMRQIVGDNHIICHLAGYKSYQRQVAQCFTLDGTDIGEELIRQGWAIEDTLYTNRYAAAEREAIGFGAGRWKEKFLSDTGWTLNTTMELLGMLIAAAGVVLTVFFASKSAREGAIAGAAEQAKLAQDAEDAKLLRERQQIRSILYVETFELLNHIASMIYICDDSGNVMTFMKKAEYRVFDFWVQKWMRSVSAQSKLVEEDQHALTAAISDTLNLIEEIESPEESSAPFKRVTMAEHALWSILGLRKSFRKDRILLSLEVDLLAASVLMTLYERQMEYGDDIDELYKTRLTQLTDEFGLDDAERRMPVEVYRPTIYGRNIVPETSLPPLATYPK